MIEQAPYNARFLPLLACAIRDTLRAPEHDAGQAWGVRLSPELSSADPLRVYTLYADPAPWRRYGLDMRALTAIKPAPAKPELARPLFGRVREWFARVRSSFLTHPGGIMPCSVRTP
jgi:hypothetical protein